MESGSRLREMGLRILHLPNEGSPGPDHEQVGPRRAMQALADAGEAEAYEPYSYVLRHQALGPDWQAELLEVARAFDPDLVVWQNVDDVPISTSTLDALKGLPRRPRLIYHEGDPHSRLLSRLTPSAKALFAAADLALVVGSGYLTDIARRAGSPWVVNVVQPYDADRFGGPWEPTTERSSDAVMIGNLGTTRIPGVMFPGARRRREFARRLCRALGPDRFALYGSGWDAIPCARGRVPFDGQTEAIRSAWVSVNWDHWDTEPSYASDRLAISMAAGVAHLTTRHPGYETQYPPCPGLLLADTPADGVRMLQEVLAEGPEALRERGIAARRYAEAHLEARVVWRRWISMAVERLFADRTR